MSEQAEQRAQAIRELRAIQDTITPEERLDFWRDLQEGYCTHCGEKRLPCYCNRDE